MIRSSKARNLLFSYSVAGDSDWLHVWSPLHVRSVLSKYIFIFYRRLFEYWLVFVFVQTTVAGSIHSYYYFCKEIISSFSAFDAPFDSLLRNYVARTYISIFPLLELLKSSRFFWRDRSDLNLGFISPSSPCMYINNSSGINPIRTLFGSKVFRDAQQILTLSNWKACSILQGSYKTLLRSLRLSDCRKNFCISWNGREINSWSYLVSSDEVERSSSLVRYRESINSIYQSETTRWTKTSNYHKKVWG